MRLPFLLGFCFVCFICDAEPTGKDSSGPVVETPYGTVEGFVHKTNTGRNVNAFLGIRYGKAPDHIFRFEKPEPVEKWHFLHHAKKFRASCIPYHREAFERENYSEDCLFVNVVTPDLNPIKPLPVMVFIHGGGFEIGDAESYGFKNVSDNFVSKGIVFASIQYRLGPLGFFTTGDSELPGNLGLWDQTLALQFLNEVLPSFGGDPDRITLIGHSAGSASVSALLFSPHSDHLFQQAIELSGSIFAEFSLSEAVVEESRALAVAVGCDKETSKLLKDCMQERTMEEILDGVVKIGTNRRHPNFIKFHPHFDNDFFPFEVDRMASKAPKKITLQGVTDNEAALFTVFQDMGYFISEISIPKERWSNFSRPDLLSFISDAVATEIEFGKNSPLLKMLTEFYVDKDAPENPDAMFYIKRYTELISDLMMIIPTIHEIDLKRRNGWETYFYVIDYQSQGTKDFLYLPGAYHAMELRFLFEFSGQELIPLDSKDKKFQNSLLDTFVKFIKTGSPATTSLPWQPVSSEHPQRHLRFNSDSAMEETFRKEAIDFWINEVPKKVGTELLKKGRLPAASAHNTNKHSEL